MAGLNLVGQRFTRLLVVEEAVTKPVRKRGNRDAYVPVPNFKIENYIQKGDEVTEVA